MANQKVTDLTTKATAAAADILLIVDATTNSSKQTTIGGIAVAAAQSVPAGGLTLSQVASASELFFDFVVPGGAVLTSPSGLNWSLSAGAVYIGGVRYTVATASGTLTASKDTYFDLLIPGSGTVATLVNTGGNIVANNAASPALAANSVRLGIMVSGAAALTAGGINQGLETALLPIASSTPYAVTDSLGNLICPHDPNRKTLGYREIRVTFSTSSSSPVQVTGLSCPVIVPAGRRVEVEVFIPEIVNAAAGTAVASLWDGTVGSGARLDYSSQSFGGTGFLTDPDVKAVTSPASSTKTYNAGLSMSSATSITIDATATGPAYIIVRLA
jgi:hypothetical protein